MTFQRRSKSNVTLIYHLYSIRPLNGRHFPTRRLHSFGVEHSPSPKRQQVPDHGLRSTRQKRSLFPVGFRLHSYTNATKSGLWGGSSWVSRVPH